MIFPSALEEEDFEDLFANEIEIEDTKFEDTFLFSLDFLKKCTKALKDRVVQYVKSPDPVRIEDPKKKKGKKGKKGNDDDDDDFACILR